MATDTGKGNPELSGGPGARNGGHLLWAAVKNQVGTVLQPDKSQNIEHSSQGSVLNYTHSYHYWSLLYAFLKSDPKHVKAIVKKSLI